MNGPCKMKIGRAHEVVSTGSPPSRLAASSPPARQLMGDA